MIKRELTYDDISLFSRQISTVKSRFDDKIFVGRKIKFGEKIIDTGIFMSAPMYDVTGVEMQIKLLNEGQIPIIHRFMKPDEQIDSLKEVLERTNNNENYIYSYSIGINDYKEKFKLLTNLLTKYKNLNILICIDTANGASELLLDVLNKINEYKKYYTNNNIEILTGNVVTKEACEFLIKHGVKFIRCGISSGSACSTSVVTGIYRPPVSMLLEINEWREKNNVEFYIVADGGIRNTDDMLKAIACGADYIMSGRLFAGYDESNSDIIYNYENYFYNDNELFEKVYDTNGSFAMNIPINKRKTTKYKKYRGMASMEMAELNNKVNNLDKQILPEGVTDYVEYRGDRLSEDLKRYLNSIRSSMSYANAYDLLEYEMNIDIVEITDNSNNLRKPLNRK